MKTNPHREISLYTPTLSELPGFIQQHLIDTLGAQEKYAGEVVRKQLVPVLEHLRSDLHLIVEVPYVDKMYRDTYYNYYASRLKHYERDTIRISFFEQHVSAQIQPTKEAIQTVVDSHVGFLLIRPTLPRIVGRNAIHPRGLKNAKFVCCRAPIQSTTLGIKVTTSAFPHASQDGQVLSCAETTIWSILEYFGNKYPEYRPILPSDGLTAEQIAFVLREVGFGTMIYSQTKHKEGFGIALSMFIESGIPVIGVLKSPTLGHAVNIVGRELDDRSKLLAASQAIIETGDLIIHDFHKMSRDYVFIDDNLPPYQLVPIGNPCKNYNDDEWKKCELATIIVPLYSRIYLDAIRARKNFLVMLQDNLMSLSPAEPVLFRAFLASSRSYKDYLARNDQMDTDVREVMLLLAMPKFIWVGEIYSFKSFENQLVVGLMLQDATDPVDYSQNNASRDMSVFFGLFKSNFFTILDGEVCKFKGSEKSFPEYCANLR